ncbi:hypothetical protein C8R45DRAFT_953310 [Mycena sanguinolenta]|nr:hypothetical protein C8R45DRAFT_953310 [Mycena sanguinolenta]
MLDAIPSESLFSLLTAARTAAPLSPIPIPNFGPLNWGDVLEIQGPSGSGKTQMLYLLLATSIMPCSLDGWGKAAVVFDTEGCFDLRNFHRVLLSRLARACARSNSSSDDAQLLAETALHKLHVFCPASTAQLAASIYNLPAYQKTHMPDADIGLVAVDSLSAFYWPDRFTAEQLRPLVNSGATGLQHVLTCLQKFRLSHNPVTVLTNWALTLADNSDSSGPPPAFYKQHLPFFPSFPDSAAPNRAFLPLTHHITLYLPNIPPYHGDTVSHSGPDVGRVTGYIRRRGRSHISMFVVDIRIDAM